MGLRRGQKGCSDNQGKDGKFLGKVKVSSGLSLEHSLMMVAPTHDTERGKRRTRFSFLQTVCLQGGIALEAHEAGVQLWHM